MRNETQSPGQRRRRCLVLVPCPYQGHINPMLQLGTILHSNGFSITIGHTDFNSPDPKTHPHFCFLPIPDGLSQHDISTGDIAHIISTINDNCKLSFQQLVEQKQHEIACIIFDEHMYFCDAVAANLKLPSIALRTTSAATFLARSAVISLIRQGCLPFQASSLRFKDLPIPRSADHKPFTQVVSETYKIRNYSAVIWNTMDCLEHSCLSQIQQENCPVPIFPIGPLHKTAQITTSTSYLKEDANCISWLDKQSQNSVIYVSLGSIASIDGVGDRGCFVKWAPQKEVLAHEAVGGFWSHCGWNSTLESISEGVPMICKPCFGDQRVNARYVSREWMVGLELEKMERGEIERAVRRLILDNEGKEMRARAKHLKEKLVVVVPTVL
ncbi:hypothetical protein FNV43_RR05064 [Rhamnella rubrinervis]|uniref:UDP-glycosyltransferase n=1 Tax=Rhamnella rubrinervis TaxID=2594499 RepID=A0A8K0HLF1_9ROSA|nr:hypothetical protein FNV43_RR05064 [Rhamnella rubrinervis]